MCINKLDCRITAINKGAVTMKPTMLSRVFAAEFSEEIWGLDPEDVEFQRKMRDIRCTYCAGWEL